MAPSRPSWGRPATRHARRCASSSRADPFKPELIRDLQWKVQRFDALAGYVNAILEAGKAAHADISESEALHALRTIRGEETPTED